MSSYGSKAEALSIARDVAEQLGPPWKPYVWDNLGWHARVEFRGGYLGDEGGMSLYIDPENRTYKYSVMAIDRTIGDGRTPAAAVRKAHKHLAGVVSEANRLMVPLWSAMQRRKKVRS